jgi:5'-3' exonuclease
MLCTEKIVAAAYSNDTDTLAYGCPLVITEFDKAHKDHVKCVRLDKALITNKWTYAQFVDLCIMSGTDYNDNIPDCAALTASRLLDRCMTIENLPKHLDTTCLNHVRGRELFKYRTSAGLMTGVLQTEVNKEALVNARDQLDCFGLSSYIHTIASLYQTLDTGPGLLDGLNLRVVNDIEVLKPAPKILRLKIMPNTMLVDHVNSTVVIG